MDILSKFEYHQNSLKFRFLLKTNIKKFLEFDKKTYPDCVSQLLENYKHQDLIKLLTISFLLPYDTIIEIIENLHQESQLLFPIEMNKAVKFSREIFDNFPFKEFQKSRIGVFDDIYRDLTSKKKDIFWIDSPQPPIQMISSILVPFAAFQQDSKFYCILSKFKYTSDK